MVFSMDPEYARTLHPPMLLPFFSWNDFGSTSLQESLQRSASLFLKVMHFIATCLDCWRLQIHMSLFSVFQVSHVPDRPFYFKLPMAYYSQEVMVWIRIHKEKNLTR
jgi:hypothetical protein